MSRRIALEGISINDDTVSTFIVATEELSESSVVGLDTIAYLSVPSRIVVIEEVRIHYPFFCFYLFLRGVRFDRWGE